MIHKACMPVYMNSGKIVADGRDGTGGKIEGTTRGPRGPKNSMTVVVTVVLINLGPGGGRFTLISDLDKCEELKVLNAISDVTYRNDDIIALCHCVP